MEKFYYDVETDGSDNFLIRYFKVNEQITFIRIGDYFTRSITN